MIGPLLIMIKNTLNNPSFKKELEKLFLQSTVKNRGAQIFVVKQLGNPATGQYISKTISEFSSTYRRRLDDGEYESKTVVQTVEKTYKVGNVSNADVIQGEHIIKCEHITNNTTININITVKNYEELMNMVPEISKLRSQLENNIQKVENNIQDYDDLRLFANKELDPFLGKVEKILSESVEYIN